MLPTATARKTQAPLPNSPGGASHPSQPARLPKPSYQRCISRMRHTQTGEGGGWCQWPARGGAAFADGRWLSWVELSLPMTCDRPPGAGGLWLRVLETRRQHRWSVGVLLEGAVAAHSASNARLGDWVESGQAWAPLRRLSKLAAGNAFCKGRALFAILAVDQWMMRSDGWGHQSIVGCVVQRGGHASGGRPLAGSGGPSALPAGAQTGTD